MNKKLSPAEEKVLTLLKTYGKKGVPNYVFARNFVLSYRARISDLRKKGYVIGIERKLDKEGKPTSVFIYRLIGEPRD